MKTWIAIYAALVLGCAILLAMATSSPHTEVSHSSAAWNTTFGPAPNGFWEWLYTGKLPLKAEKVVSNSNGH